MSLPDLNLLGLPFIVPLEANENGCDLLEKKRKECCLPVQLINTALKYMSMSRHQTAGQDHNMKACNKTFETVAKLKCLGTTITNCNYDDVLTRT
jgi:hypothetical protein